MINIRELRKTHKIQYTTQEEADATIISENSFEAALADAGGQMLKIFISPKETIQPETDPNVQAIIVEMQNEKVELWKDNERLKAENRY